MIANVEKLERVRLTWTDELWLKVRTLRDHQAIAVDFSVETARRVEMLHRRILNARRPSPFAGFRLHVWTDVVKNTLILWVERSGAAAQSPMKESETNERK